MDRTICCVRAAVVLSALLAGSPAWAQPQEKRPGIGVDAQGAQVIDPTRNVLDLVLAAVTRLNDLMARAEQRQDDLRVATKELFDAKLESVSELASLRSKYDKELLKASTDRVDSEAKLRAQHAAEINATEKDRVNAIRTVDTSAVAISNDRAVATATGLAVQVARTADDLRTLVKTTADENNRNVQQQFTAISTRIAALETGSAEGLGRQKFQDPALAELLKKVETLTQSRADLAGVSSGSSATIALIVGGILLLLSLISAASAVVVAVKRTSPRK